MVTKIKQAQEQAIHSLHANGVSHEKISRQTGITLGSVRRCLERLEAFKRGFRETPYAVKPPPPQSVPGYEPTEEEIAEACAKIQAGWTPAAERKRRVCKSSEIEIAEVIRHPHGIHVIRRDVGRR